MSGSTPAAREDRSRRLAFGDFQTPSTLAREVVARVARGRRFAAAVEPTCGRGAFLAAARAAFPDARLLGVELDPGHLAAARAALGDGAEIEAGDFFAIDWSERLRALPRPLLVIGNPPWVTTATLGALDAANAPRRSNARVRLSGLDAITGKANFDVSEWIVLRLLDAMHGLDATLAMLLKTAVARRVVARLAAERRPLDFELVPIDAAAHFGAGVAAGLLIARPSREGAADRADAIVVPDAAAARATRHLEGECAPPWRSGVKHDCARVMELRAGGGGRWINGLGEAVDVEPDHVFPLLKCTDVARDRLDAARAVIVPQRGLGDDTRALRESAPRTWAYLEAHASALGARRSSIYRGRPPFAVFGVGPYTFAPWKVAISALHKSLEFRLVGPRDGRPVVFDDACLLLPFDAEEDARAAHAKLRSAEATRFFRARIFWDAKRPLTRSLLQTLDLSRV